MGEDFHSAVGENAGWVIHESAARAAAEAELALGGSHAEAGAAASLAWTSFTDSSFEAIIIEEDERAMVAAKIVAGLADESLPSLEEVAEAAVNAYFGAGGSVAAHAGTIAAQVAMERGA
jgi:hypothetical protein